MDYDRLRELQEKFEENPRRYFAPLANEYRKGGQPKRAIEICRSQLSQMPGHMSGQIVYGQSLYECGEFDEAKQVFERALTLDPENLIALRSLGDMSLQSGNTVEARKWYMRLLDADPHDAAVIALVSEIDASAEAAPVPTPQEIPGVDEDAGDQAIPFIAGAEGAPVGTDVESSPVESATAPSESSPTASAASAPASEAAAPSAPVSESTVASAPESAPMSESIAASPPESPPSAVSRTTPPLGLERHYPVEPAAAERPIDPGMPDQGLGAEGLEGHRQDEQMGAEGLHGAEPEQPPEPVGAEGLHGKPVPAPLAGASGSRSDDENALETWTPPPGATVHERKESRKEDRLFVGPGPEPFVNETMAQLYLQQGYRQLALRVYYQLAESRPNDQVLKDRIAEIEAADQAAHPEAAVHSRKETPSIESSRGTPAAPREPSIETPPYREEPVASPPPSQAPRYRESVEAPQREAPRVEPEGIAARQPSVREFFATLGRRRPPRSTASPGGNSRPPGNMTSDIAPTPGGAPTSASLDAVFAGATVSAADSRAASRLAGAFSGAAGTSRTSPPTPPVPTPRVNPRVPQAQESEEDVAKFRAWLDGLTGE
ncbi:MAG: tetratricopeptide repeat protein [Gemmatimonadaceae bacterium]